MSVAWVHSLVVGEHVIFGVMHDNVLLLQFLGDEDVPEEEISEGEGRDELSPMLSRD